MSNHKDATVLTGWITNIEDDGCIYVRFDREYANSLILETHEVNLSCAQLELLSEGRIVKYDLDTQTIWFAQGPDSERDWI